MTNNSGQINVHLTPQNVGLDNGNQSTMYVAHVKNYTNISSKDFLKSVEHNYGIKAGHLQAAMDAIFNEMKNLMVNGHSITLDHLGTFRVSIMSDAVENVEDFDPKKHIKRRKIIFCPNKELKSVLNGIEFVPYE